MEVSPEAIHQRMNQQASALLQDRLRQVLAKLHARAPVGDEGLLSAVGTGSMTDRTGLELPAELHKPFPGAGGSAANAGAKRQAVWDDQSSLFDQVALPPGHIPDQRSVDTVVAVAPTGRLWIVAFGSLKVTAVARLARAGA